MPETSSPQDNVLFYSELLRAYFDSANDAIFVLCDEMKFLTCNKKTQDWLGHSEEELTLHNKRIPITELLGSSADVDFFEHSFKKALDSNNVIFETRINPPKGKERWIELSMKRVEIEEGDMVIAIARDITQRKKNVATIQYKTNYDQLTDLPNKNYLKTVVLADNKKNNKIDSITLLSIDLDRFKEVNESLGHQIGDLILQQIAQRLNTLIDYASNELLARLEGDEFAILLPETNIDDAKDIASRVKHIISRPLSISGKKISIDCSIGISNFPEHTRNKGKLIQYAESAMYTAKFNKQGVGIYDFSVHKTTTERLQLATYLRDAISKKQIVPYYQPIININKPEEIRIETLARWQHDSQGFISPETFIPLAEDIGIINILTSNILDASIEQCADLLQQGLIKTISINISAYYMTNPNIVDSIKALLQKHSILAEQIVFEITESAMMSNTIITDKIISELHQFGIRFSIDDFGTGYSSLFKLKQLPLAELKIDKSFILDITNNENDAAIAQASIQMAHALGLEVVAEGIEYKEVWDLLYEMGCDYGQGFWMAKPMPIEELITWFETKKVYK